MKNNLPTLVASTALALMTGAAAQAAQWEVSVQNLTHGNYFTPLLVTAHGSGMHLYQLGMPASAALEAMAECGDLSGLLASAEVGGVDGDTVANPASGLLAPGATTTATLMTTQDHLSVVAMVLPTNDGFIALNSQSIPSAAGTYTYFLNAYDAGTEANDEMLSTTGTCSPADSGMIPAAPGMDGGANGSGVTTTETNKTVHVHRGVLGDSDPMAGKSDLDSSIHRWQNPVARVTVKVTP